MLPAIDALHVVKRDGSQEPFDIEKLLFSIAGALADADQDTALAGPLAEAVAWHLCREGSACVRSSELGYQLQRVLEQVGQATAAICYAGDAARRAAGRRRLRVLPAAGATWSAQPWDRRRWVQDASRHGLSGRQARTLVSRVERRLLRLGLNPVSEVLVRELLACEQQTCSAAAP